MVIEAQVVTSTGRNRIANVVNTEMKEKENVRVPSSTDIVVLNAPPIIIEKTVIALVQKTIVKRSTPTITKKRKGTGMISVAKKVAGSRIRPKDTGQYAYLISVM